MKRTTAPRVILLAALALAGCNTLGKGKRKAIEDAPGRYVKTR